MASDLDPATIDKSFEPLQEMIAVPVDGRSSLWLSWHFLQVYATWGIRLPTTTEDFTALMGSSPAGYDFFPPLQDGNKIVSEACTAFLQEGYPTVVRVARDLLSYSGDASPADGALFEAVAELIDAGATEDALILLSDLQDNAASCAERAEAAGKSLASLSTDLDKAIGKFDTAREALDRDSKTNEAALDKLGADDAAVAGSIAAYDKLIEEAKAEYQHDVIVASTSPTYCWAVPPIGMISAVVVAGVYGDRAVKKLREIEQLETDLKKAKAELRAALASRHIFTTSDQGLRSVARYTHQARASCGVVREAWAGVQSSIDDLKKWIDKTTRLDADGEMQPQSKAILKIYLGRLGAAWQAMAPALEDLTTDNYIAVDPGMKSISELAAMVQKAA